MLTSRKGNGNVPADPKYLYKHLPISSEPNIQPLIDAGFIEIVDKNAIKTLSILPQNACPETDKRQSKTETDKDKYLEFVYLSKEEFQKLKTYFGSDVAVNLRIASLNDYIGSKGVKYKSHYHTILNWARKDGSIKGVSIKPVKHCFVCREPATEMICTGRGEQDICAACLALLKAAPNFIARGEKVIPKHILEPSQLETMILKQKGIRI